MRLPAILIATLLASPGAMAQLYKCTGPDGKVNFTDSPCKGTEQAQTLQRVPPQGLDKMRIELEQHRVDQQKWEADYQASLAAEAQPVPSASHARRPAHRHDRGRG